MKQSISSQHESEERSYISIIISRIANAMKARHMTQKDLADKCGYSPATLSKLMKGDSALTVKQVYTLCKALDLQIDKLLSESANYLDSIETTAAFLIENRQEIPKKKSDSGSLIQKYLDNASSIYKDSILFDPTRPAFRGIVNDPQNKDDFYYFYTKPTISEEKKSFLKGKLKLTPSDTPTPYCIAELDLETGQIDKNQKPVIKHYSGEALISLPMRTCYLLLFSPQCAEVNMISFQHMFLNHEQLSCRLGACLTTSAGANRRPTMEKCIITRTELDDSNLSILEGQLFINTSKIQVKSTVLDSPENKELKEKVFHALGINLDSFIQESSQTALIPNITQYYEFEEMMIRAAADLSSKDKIELINRLRKLSNTPRYAKVSSTADEFIYSYITNLMSQPSNESID